jgi:hypothetical protein
MRFHPFVGVACFGLVAACSSSPVAEAAGAELRPTPRASGESSETFIPLAPLPSIISWDPAPEQEHAWQGGRNIDPWLISEREYVDRRRKNAGLAAFIQLGFWVLGGKARS